MTINKTKLFIRIALIFWCLFLFFRDSFGYFTLTALFLGALFTRKKNLIFSWGQFFFISFYCLSWLLFVLITQYAHIPSTYFNISILILVTLLFFYLMRKNYSKKEPDKKNGFEDFLYFFLLVYYSFYIINLYIKGQWNIFGGTYVSFAIEVILVYLIGYKRNHIYTSCFLMGLSLFLIPARTLKLFFIIHLLLVIFRNLKLKFHYSMKIGKLMILLFIATTIVAVLIGVVLPLYCDFFDGHGEITQLYDSSNVARFRAHIYSVVVLLKKMNLFWGVANDDYLYFIDLGFPVYHHPHNSYLQLLIFYSVSFGFMSLYLLSRIMNPLYKGKNISIIIPFLFIACIYHDLFTTQLFFILVVLAMDERVVKKKNISILKYNVKGIDKICQN